MLGTLRRWREARRVRRAERQAARTARLAAEWEPVVPYVGAGPSASVVTCVGRIVDVRQRARTGTKAYVEWSNGTSTAAWFEGAWPSLHADVLATGNLGRGPHHRETVFYVEPGALWIVPAGAREAYERSRLQSPAPPPPPPPTASPTASTSSSSFDPDGVDASTTGEHAMGESGSAAESRDGNRHAGAASSCTRAETESGIPPGAATPPPPPSRTDAGRGLEPPRDRAHMTKRRGTDRSLLCLTCGGAFSAVRDGRECHVCGARLVRRDGLTSLDPDPSLPHVDSSTAEVFESSPEASPQAPPLWWLLGREIPRSVPRCRGGEGGDCVSPSFFDVFCSDHDVALLSKPDGPRTRWMVHGARVAAVGAFVVSAQWTTSLPLYALFALAVGGLLVAPLRHQPRTLRAAVAAWVVAAATIGALSEFDLSREFERIATTTALVVVGVGWVAYAGAGSGRAQGEMVPHAPEGGGELPSAASDERTARLARVGVGVTLASGVATLVGWLTLRAWGGEHVVSVPDVVSTWLGLSAAGAIPTAMLVAGIAASIRSFHSIDREVVPPLKDPESPRGFGSMPAPSRPSFVGATAFERIGVAARFLGLRVRHAATEWGRGVVRFLQRSNYLLLQLIVAVGNTVHGWVVRLGRRIVATLSYGSVFFAGGARLVVVLGRDFGRGLLVPVSALGGALVVVLGASDSVTRYLANGPLVDVFFALLMGCAAVALTFTAWWAWSGAPIAPAARSQGWSILVVAPNLFILFVVAAWGVGLAGTLGVGPIHVGEVTIASSAALISVALMSSRSFSTGSVQASGRHQQTTEAEHIGRQRQAP